MKCCWHVGNDSSISVSKDHPWLLDVTNPRITIVLPYELPEIRVYELILDDGHWSKVVLENLFYDCDCALKL